MRDCTYYSTANLPGKQGATPSPAASKDSAVINSRHDHDGLPTNDDASFVNKRGPVEIVLYDSCPIVAISRSLTELVVILEQAPPD